MSLYENEMSYVDAFNSSKIAWGLSTVGMQMGARFVVGDLTAMQNRMLASKLAKRLIMCGMIFVATRDIMISVVLTIAIHGLLTFLINEDSGMCIVPGAIPTPDSKIVTKEAYEAALAVTRAYEAQGNVGTQTRKRIKPPRLYHPMRTNTLA
jgi:hypothetical protein